MLASLGVLLFDRSDKPQLNQMHHGFVAHAPRDALQKLGMRDRIEVAGQIRIDYFPVASDKQLMHRLHRRLCAAMLAVGILLRLQIRFEDWLQHDQRRRLDGAVGNRRDSQRALFPVWLWDVHTANGLRLVSLRSQFVCQFCQPLHHAVCLDFLECLPVDAGCAIVVTTALPSHPQYIQAINLVVQRVEAVRRLSLRFGVQRRL
jgi:hypothetical protein